MIGWLLDIVRSLFFAIDSIVYKFIDTVYSLFLEIANTSIFSQEMIDEFAGKVYALVGIFMLFKVSFSLLTYIINPDEFTDKSKGMGKLVKNIITSLMLFILVPIIFREAMDIQRIVLRDDIIPRMFSTSQVVVSSQDPSMGSYMAVTTFQAFYQIEGDYDIETIFNTDVNKKDDYDHYIVKYVYIISTVVGVVLLLILISFCFDIAVRSVKIGFLRLIAPVPIMTRIDPKKGSELFNKWIQTCISTYLDLFMRLTAIFFAIYIIKAVGDLATGGGFVDAVTGEQIEVSTFVVVFLILGSLMFAKQLPKLIEDLFGIKLSGTFNLNPAKKLAEVPVAGKLAAATAGALDSGFHGNGFRAGFKRNWNNVPLGGDGKTSILQTADRKMRKEINEKRDTARQRYEGIKEFDDMHEQWEQGDDARRRIDRISTLPHHGNNWYKNFDGTNSKAYEAVYNNSEFISSLMNLDKADEEAKALSQAYSKAQIEGFRGPVTVNGTSYATLDKLIEANEKAAKVKAGAEKVHDTMRKKYTEDAKMQDAIKMRKNNPKDPTSL